MILGLALVGVGAFFLVRRLGLPWYLVSGLFLAPWIGDYNRALGAGFWRQTDAAVRRLTERFGGYVRVTAFRPLIRNDQHSGPSRRSWVTKLTIAGQSTTIVVALAPLAGFEPASSG